MIGEHGKKMCFYRHPNERQTPEPNVPNRMTLAERMTKPMYPEKNDIGKGNKRKWSSDNTWQDWGKDDKWDKHDKDGSWKKW